MKYLIPGVLFLYSGVLAVCVSFCLYKATTDGWTWLILGLALGYTLIVGILATTAAFSAVKDW